MANESVNDAIRVNPTKWVKFFFSTISKCDIVDNNLAETFNSWILELRKKPLITMLDEIRMMVMNRIHMKRRSLVEKLVGVWLVSFHRET